MACSRNAAIVLAGVNVLEVRRDSSKCIAKLLLLDVGMEGIEQNADTRIVNGIAQRHGVFRGIQEIRLEAIQRFDGDLDAVTLEHGSELLITLDRPLPFVSGSAAPRQVSHGRIQRAADQSGSHVGGRLYTVLHV